MSRPEASFPWNPIRDDTDPRTQMIVLEREEHSVAAARQWLATVLDEHRVPAGACADAVLVLSELVTNALRHGLGEVVVRTALGEHQEINLSVTDSGSELPELLDRDPERVGGVGLYIVEQLSSAWGVAAFPGGKTVWARIVPVKAS